MGSLRTVERKRKTGWDPMMRVIAAGARATTQTEQVSDSLSLAW